ncbi:MAG: sugar-binding transcriptional regulator [Gulosibacter sp.]|uniref:sugar-binding transcriptional regulator n=1 Tax=Gulosibacter sp. TaxID=2817531 RepID=UPI003F927C81
MDSQDQDLERIRRAATAAHLYYVQDRTTDAIARELSVSRSTVSRLLTYARETGIVEIRVQSPFDAPESLETQLGHRFGIRANVVPVPNKISEVERLDRVATAAAHVLADLILPSAVIGLAWGSTISAVSRHLIPKRDTGSTFVQINGSGNTHSTGVLYASELLSRFAHAYDARAQQFPVPAFFDDADTKKAMWRERSTQRILRIQHRMSLVIFSVGAADAGVPSHVYAGGYLDRNDLKSLRDVGVVGDVATVFYRQDGSSDGIPLNERATGPSLAQLRSVARRCCVVSGGAKSASLRGALAAGLITDLVIDSESARLLLN